MNMNCRKRKISLSVTSRGLMLLMLCLHCTFTFFNPDAYMGIADYFVFLAMYIVFSVFANKKLVLKQDVKYVLALICYLMISLMNAASQGIFSTGYFFSYAIYLIVMMIMLSQDYTEIEIKRLINAYVISAVVIAVLLFVQRYDYYGSGNERHTIKILTHDVFDPNFLAAFLVAPAILAFSKIVYHFSFRNMIAFLVIIAGILYTSSRGAFLSAIMGIGIVILGFFRESKSGKHMMIVAFVLLLGCFLVVEFIPNNSLIRIINFKSYYDGSNAKRLLDWKLGMMAFFKRPILGYGLQGEMSIIKKALGMNYISHNTFIAFLLQFGIAGFSIILACVLRLFRNIKSNSVLKGVLLSTMAVSIFISAEVALAFWIPIMFVAVISMYERRSRTTNEWL